MLLFLDYSGTNNTIYACPSWNTDEWSFEYEFPFEMAAL